MYLCYPKCFQQWLDPKKYVIIFTVTGIWSPVAKEFWENIRRLYVRMRKEVGKPNRTRHEWNFPHVTWTLFYSKDNNKQTRIMPRYFTTSSKYKFIFIVSIESCLFRCVSQVIQGERAKITLLTLYIFCLLVGWHKSYWTDFQRNLDGWLNTNKVCALLPKCTFISRSSTAGNVFTLRVMTWAVRTSACWCDLTSGWSLVLLVFNTLTTLFTLDDFFFHPWAVGRF